MKLQDKVAIVTGAGDGIGREIALSFARQGARIVVPEIDPARGQAVAEAVAALGGQALPLQTDVGDSAQVEAAVAAALERFGKVDILVNNAGIASLKPFWELTDTDWDRVLKVNLYGAFYFGRAVARHMIDRRAGKILNVASISGVIGSLGRGAYGASKGGVITLTKVMAVELAKHGINVNAIAPGPINTSLVSSNISEEALAHYTSYIPFKRFGETDEVAAAALFLCCDDSRYITGQTLAVDGGFLAAGVLEARSS